MMASLGHELSKEASAKLFAKMDEDGNGNIDYEEFFTVASAFKAEDGVFTAETFTAEKLADKFKSHISNRVLQFASFADFHKNNLAAHDGNKRACVEHTIRQFLENFECSITKAAGLIGCMTFTGFILIVSTW